MTSSLTLKEATFKRPESPWNDVGTVIDSEAALAGQQRGKELECRVLAVHKVDEGEPSDTVMALLQGMELGRAGKAVKGPVDDL